MPKSLTTGNTSLILSPDFKIKIQVMDAPSDLNDAVSRTTSYLKNDQLGRLVVGRGTNDIPLLHSAAQVRSLELSLTDNSQVRAIAAEAILPLAERHEEYILLVPEDGSPATLSANSTLGLLRGLTTFEQLWYSIGGSTYTLQAPISIHDAPAFVSTTISVHDC